MTTDQKSCQSCENQPEEYIQLACSHNFCLACLAYSYLNYLNEEENNEQKEIIQLPCEICKKYTQLDKQSIETLEQVLQQILIQQEQDEKLEKELKNGLKDIKVEESNKKIKEQLQEQDYQKKSYMKQLEYEQKDKKTDSDYYNDQYSFQKAKSQMKLNLDQIDINQLNKQYTELQLQKNQLESEQNKFQTKINRFQQDLQSKIQEQVNLFELQQKLKYKTQIDSLNENSNKIQEQIIFYQNTYQVINQNNKNQIIKYVEDNQYKELKLNQVRIQSYDFDNLNQKFQNILKNIEKLSQQLNIDQNNYDYKLEFRSQEKKISNLSQNFESTYKSKFDTTQDKFEKYDLNKHENKFEQYDRSDLNKYETNRNNDIGFDLKYQQYIQEKKKQFELMNNNSPHSSMNNKELFSQYDQKSPTYLKSLEMKNKYENNINSYQNNMNKYEIYNKIDQKIESKVDKYELPIKSYTNQIQKKNYEQELYQNNSIKYENELVQKLKKLDQQYGNKRV